MHMHFSCAVEVIIYDGGYDYVGDDDSDDDAAVAADADAGGGGRI